MVQKEPVVYVVVGPTASGKTAYAIDLAKKVGGEVISADSRQVYKGLDIGSGKVTKREMQGIPHHLLDVVSPKKIFTAADFAQRGRKALLDILARGKTPIIAGGTGFYIDTLLGRVTLSDAPRNDALRVRLSTKSPAQLFTLLKKKDARRAAMMDTPSERNNKVRLIRAIEIASSHPSTSSPILVDLPPLSLTWVYLAPPMDTLRTKIHTRLIARMKVGMVAEAKRLHTQGVSYKRMEALGLEYRYLARLLQKKITKEEFLTQLESAIYDYAKRQVTYFKRNKDVRRGHR
jgi:tRNA dimethylallyltransferase